MSQISDKPQDQVDPYKLLDLIKNGELKQALHIGRASDLWLDLHFCDPANHQEIDRIKNEMIARIESYIRFLNS
jgi:hypothetical protein